MAADDFLQGASREVLRGLPASLDEGLGRFVVHERSVVEGLLRPFDPGITQLHPPPGEYTRLGYRPTEHDIGGPAARFHTVRGVGAYAHRNGATVL